MAVSNVYFRPRSGASWEFILEKIAIGWKPGVLFVVGMDAEQKQISPAIKSKSGYNITLYSIRYNSASAR